MLTLVIAPNRVGCSSYPRLEGIDTNYEGESIL